MGRTVDAGSVRQSFSHGRSKVVQVEVRKKRAPLPTNPSAAAGAPPPPPAGGTPAPRAPAPGARPRTRCRTSVDGDRAGGAATRAGGATEGRRKTRMQSGGSRRRSQSSPQPKKPAVARKMPGALPKRKLGSRLNRKKPRRKPGAWQRRKPLPRIGNPQPRKLKLPSRQTCPTMRYRRPAQLRYRRLRPWSSRVEDSRNLPSLGQAPVVGRHQRRSKPARRSNSVRRNRDFASAARHHTARGRR